MNNQDNANNRNDSQGVSKATVVVLVIALAIAVWGWYNAAGTAAEGSFEDQLVVCEDPTTEQELNECYTLLEDFSETLQEYAEDLQNVEIENEAVEDTATATDADEESAQ